MPTRITSQYVFPHQLSKITLNQHGILIRFFAAVEIAFRLHIGPMQIFLQGRPIFKDFSFIAAANGS